LCSSRDPSHIPPLEGREEWELLENDLILEAVQWLSDYVENDK